jgi:molybdate transport system substrate-binding protein
MKVLQSILILILTVSPARAELTVFAAASMNNVMRRLAAEFEAGGGEKIRFNFAGSGALARQVDAGAPADIFVSANANWMDFLEEKELIISGTRRNIAGNSLTLVVPLASVISFEGFPSNLKDKLAVGDFQSVPAGIYALSALKSLGWLDEVQDQLVKGANVRMVLMYVERGEVDAGIVYLTDAKQSDKVRILGTLPSDSHPPITYPAAACSANKSATQFLSFMDSPEATRIFKSYGFSEPPN